MATGKRAYQKPVSFTDLETWKQGHKLVVQIYRIFPTSDGLSNQIQRSAVSITSNIAEGFGRQHIKDKIHFYVIARGSTVELQNQLLIARDITKITNAEFHSACKQATTTLKLLHGLIRSSNKKKPGADPSF